MKRSLLFGLLAPILLAGSINAGSTDYLLEIDGIKGESTDAQRPGTIEIESFNWGATNTPPTAGGGGAGKVSFSDINFTMKVSKATPQLLVACATGNAIPKAKLYCRKAGGDGHEYYVIKVENILISSLRQTLSCPGPTTGTNSAPMEQLALNFEKITIDHTGDDGTVTTGTATRTPAP